MTGCDNISRASVKVALLGGFRLTVDHETVRTAGGVQRLVAYIALCSPTTRATVAGSLWPRSDEYHAHASLRTSMWEVHRRCPALLSTNGTELRLHKEVYVDAIDLEARARRIVREPATVPIADLTGELIGRELLPGWYEDWVLTERERSRQLGLHALEAASEELLLRNKLGAAMDVALKAVSSEPLRESAHRLILRIHLAEGNTSEAARHYLRYCRMLGEEMGVAPSPQMQELAARVVPRRVTTGWHLDRVNDDVRPALWA